MPPPILTTLVALIALGVGLVYQFIHGPISPLFGLGRTILPISDFPYTCRKLQSPLLESCEHLVLEPRQRTVYAACSNLAARQGWSPGGAKLNSSARVLTDHISAMSPTFPGNDGLHNLKNMPLTGFPDDKNEMDVLGFDVKIVSGGTRRFYMINHRPARDLVTGAELDASKVGSNATIEVLDYVPATNDLKWQMTLTGEGLITPNSVLALREGGLLVTNDHSKKVGVFRDLELLLGGGSVAYCPPEPASRTSPSPECVLIIPSSPAFRHPNGIVQAASGLIYIAHTGSGLITVHKLAVSESSPPKLTQVDTIETGYPLDNLSIDEDGDIYAAAFPHTVKALAAIGKGGGPVPGTVLRIRLQADGKYEVKKVLEDRDGADIPHLMTVAVRDVKTGSFWLGGILSPFLTVCRERKGY